MARRLRAEPQAGTSLTVFGGEFDLDDLVGAVVDGWGPARSPRLGGVGSRHLRERIQPENPGHLERTRALAREELAVLPLHTYALPLLVALIYGIGEKSKRTLNELIETDREVLTSEERLQLCEALQKRPADGDSGTAARWPHG